jgi:hypothetical protein
MSDYAVPEIILEISLIDIPNKFYYAAHENLLIIPHTKMTPIGAI